jgi:hypothetical protein
MKAVLDMGLLTEGETFEQLSLHINREMFLQLLARDVPLRNLLLLRAREDLAKQIRHSQRAKRLSLAVEAPPWKRLLERLKEALRRAGGKKRYHTIPAMRRSRRF